MGWLTFTSALYEGAPALCAISIGSLGASSNCKVNPTFSFLYKKENNESIGDGLGRAPAKPLSPGGDDKPRPVASFKKTPTPFGFSCLTAIFANTSLEFCEFFRGPN